MSGKESFEEYKEYMSILTKFVDAYGDMLIAIGRIEKNTGKSLEQLTSEYMSPEAMEKLLEKLPSDVVGRMFAILFRLYILTGKDIKALTADEKMKLGDELKKLAKELEKLFLEEIPKVLRIEGNGV
ncbi:MAG: hypothetical protein QXT53_07305 [Ignisphaera sp.]